MAEASQTRQPSLYLYGHGSTNEFQFLSQFYTVGFDAASVQVETTKNMIFQTCNQGCCVEVDCNIKRAWLCTSQFWSCTFGAKILYANFAFTMRSCSMLAPYKTSSTWHIMDLEKFFTVPRLNVLKILGREAL